MQALQTASLDQEAGQGCKETRGNSSNPARQTLHAWGLHTNATGGATQMRRQRWFWRCVSISINLLGVAMIFSPNADLRSLAPSFDDVRRLALNEHAAEIKDDSRASSQQPHDLTTIAATSQQPTSGAKADTQRRRLDDKKHEVHSTLDNTISAAQEAPPKPHHSRDAWRVSWKLPDLPDIQGLQEWCKPPRVIFADLHQLESDEIDAQWRYYNSAMVLCFLGYTLIAIPATYIRNRRCQDKAEKRQQHASYIAINDDAQDEVATVRFQNPHFVGIVVSVWCTIYVVAIPALVRYGCITTKCVCGEAF